MDDSTIFTVGMFLLPLLLGPAVILVLILVGRAAARRAARGGTSGGPVPPAARWGCGLSLLFGVCAFCGLMVATAGGAIHPRSEEHTSELQSLMRISYAVFCLKKKQQKVNEHHT